MFEEKTKVMDVSTWNGLFGWNKAQTQGVKGAFIRVGSIDNASGLCYTDYQFDNNMKNVNMPWGGYWYFRPNWSATQQAGYFAGLLKHYTFQLPPVVDVEAGENTFDTKLITPSLYANRLAEFIYSTCTTLKINKMIIYTRAEYWNRMIEKRPGWSKQDLWLARYQLGLTHPWSDGNFIPRDWKVATFWQYTPNGDGIAHGNGPTSNGATSKGIDLDWFNGDEEAFNLYAGVEPEHTQQEKWMLNIDSWARTMGYNGIKPFGE